MPTDDCLVVENTIGYRPIAGIISILDRKATKIDDLSSGFLTGISIVE